MQSRECCSLRLPYHEPAVRSVRDYRSADRLRFLSHRDTQAMTKYLIVALVILGLMLTGAGMALKEQIEVNGEQKERIKEQATALEAAEKTRKEGEAAVESRDEELTAIKQTNRRMSDAINKAMAGDACADRPIPEQLDRLLRQRAPQAGQGVPAGDAPAGKADPGMDRPDVGKPGGVVGGAGGNH